VKNRKEKKCKNETKVGALEINLLYQLVSDSIIGFCLLKLKIFE